MEGPSRIILKSTPGVLVDVGLPALLKLLSFKPRPFYKTQTFVWPARSLGQMAAEHHAGIATNQNLGKLFDGAP